MNGHVKGDMDDATYSGDRVVECQVAHSELLVTEGGANVAAVEDEIAEVTPGAVFHEYTLVAAVHLEDDVHQRSCL